MKTYTVTSRYVRSTPRKARLIVDVVRGKQAEEAIVMLRAMPKFAALPVLKAVESAIANAVVAGEKKESLYIASCYADEGPVFKRFHAVSRGMAHPYVKRTSHITVSIKAKNPSSETKATSKQHALSEKTKSATKAMQRDTTSVSNKTNHQVIQTKKKGKNNGTKG
jgi:large subunit ribosomal protein L22